MESNITSMYLCIHALQVALVSCINRDDTGTPKTCIYGGTSRMRVSSQCWKRAVRMYLKERYGDTGIRTKFISKMISDRLVSEGVCNDKQATAFVKKWLGQANIISDKDSAKNTSAFFSKEQINSLYDVMRNRIQQENIEEKLESDIAFSNRLSEAVIDNPSTSITSAN